MEQSEGGGIAVKVDASEVSDAESDFLLFWGRL